MEDSDGDKTDHDRSITVDFEKPGNERCQAKYDCNRIDCFHQQLWNLFRGANLFVGIIVEHRIKLPLRDFLEPKFASLKL